MLLDALYDPLIEKVKHWIRSNCSDRGLMDEVVKVFLNKLEVFFYDHTGEDLEEPQIRIAVQQLVEETITEVKPVFIDPYRNDKGDLTVEAKISFKAMLDFILFYEQLMYSSRSFYAASRAVTAIDDILKIFDEWITESRPEEELPDEYWYLVRWYKWWAEGARSEHLEDMELNGLLVLQDIRDKMVNYFESRWGKRVVEYGVDGMLVYSKDSSFIDRIRGKKHGTANTPVERKQMKQEYGIDSADLKFLIEREEKE